jgi:hypothetical protein
MIIDRKIMKDLRILGVVAGLLVADVQADGLQTGEPITTPVFFLDDAQAAPLYEKLPEFYSSDAEYDRFLNDYYRLHLSVDDTGVYWPPHPVVGAVDMLWCVEWDSLFLPWVDRAAMGLKRQKGSPEDIPLSTLAKVAVDKFGYVWGSEPRPDARNIIISGRPKFSWPWPNYLNNSTVDVKTGWEFNDADEVLIGKYEASRFVIKHRPVDFSLKGTITGSEPSILMPAINAEAFHIPILELDITYQRNDDGSVEDLVNGIEIWWTTEEHPEFSRQRSVGMDLCALPPAEFPGMYRPYVHADNARYYLPFLMYLHPEWGRDDTRIRRIKVVVAGRDAAGTDVSINFVRATYDSRNATFNSTLVSSTRDFFMWSGNEEFLAYMMPRLRRSILFMNNHLKGACDHLLNLEHMVGHDGLGGFDDGHGNHGSYWDLIPAGLYDAETSLKYYKALRAMASLERAAAERGIKVPDVNVVAPDVRTLIAYQETAESLDRLADQVKEKFEMSFWIPETGRFCRNIDVNGEKHDYGFLHVNLHALYAGLGTEEQRRQIMSWLTGKRIVQGDTSTGSDIYRWRFAPRATTKRNETYYFWPWADSIETSRKNPDLAPRLDWGNQVQDGGAIPFTTFMDLMVRVHGADQQEVNAAYQRTLQIKNWFEQVKAAGGKGTCFYRGYYANNPAILQSPQPGGLGLDREFLSDGSLGTVFPLAAFLGIHADEDRVLTIAPALPSALDKLGVQNLYYQGCHWRIEAGKNYIDIKTDDPATAGLKLKARLPSHPKTSVYLNGKQYPSRSDGRFVWIETNLNTLRIEVR